MSTLAGRLLRKEFADHLLSRKREQQISDDLDGRAQRIMEIFEGVALRVKNNTGEYCPRPGDEELIRGAQEMLNNWAHGDPDRTRRVRDLIERTNF